MWEQEVHTNSLYLLLDFASKLELLYKGFVFFFFAGGGESVKELHTPY